MIIRKKYFFLFFYLFLIQEILPQQYCIPGRFDTNYTFSFNDIDTLGDIVYGQNINWLGQTINLDAIIAYPKFSIDTLNKRPFILLIHCVGYYF